jgi:DNA-binding transcriptional ArsR family regulator
LRILKEAALVIAEKRGKEVYYAINAVELRGCCGAFFANFACCRPLLKAPRREAAVARITSRRRRLSPASEGGAS